MTFTYVNDTTDGSYRPSSIQYTYTTLSPTVNNYEVTFTYQSRSSADNLWTYKIGGIDNEFNLVSAITASTVSGSTFTTVKAYNLTYGNGPASSRSLLTQVQECSASDCLSPTTISYQPGATGWASVTQSDGAGGTYNQSFWYYGAHMNVQGRGLDGFYAQQLYDSRNALYEDKYWSRSFPTTGMISKDVLSQNSSGTITVFTTVYTPSVATLNGTSYNERYFPYISQSVENDNEVGGSDNGNPITQVTKSYVYDNYGNATTVTTATTDEDASSPWYTQTWQTQVVRTIAPNTSEWCLSLPTQTTVENTIPGSSLTRTTSFSPDYTNCRITSQIAEPSSTTLKVSTTYGFDTCGNVNSVAIIGTKAGGGAMATRTTSANYGTHCEFPESVTNPQNETTAIAYNYALGVPSSQTDPNQLTTSWQYDNYGRKTLESRPDGTSTTYAITVCPAPNYCGVSDLRWYVLTKDLGTTGSQIRLREPFFDGFDRQRYDERVNLTGAVTKTAWLFDQLGNKKELYDPWITSQNGYHLYTHDAINRLTVDAGYQAGGTFYRESAIGYAGRTLTLTDPKSNITTKRVDVWGELRTIIDPSPGGTTSLGYEPFGHLSSVTDPATNLTSWVYNLRGYLTSSSDLDRGAWTYSPDSLGERVSQTDAKSQTTTYVYDNLSRMTSRTEAEGTSTWVWGSSASSHNIDKLQSMSGPGYSESNSYDSFARLTTTTYTADTTYTITRAYSTTTEMLDNITYPASTGTSPTSGAWKLLP